MPTLVVLAAGVGSRYGGLKQLTPLGPNGEALLDLSFEDAAVAGFDRAVLIIRHQIEREVTDHLRERPSPIPVDLAYQDDLGPARDKPWGTSHALLSTRDHVDAPFAVVNADDYYGPESLVIAADWLSAAPHPGVERYALVGFGIHGTLSPTGPVARGVCEVDDEGRLVRVVERFGVRRDADGVIRAAQPDEVEIADDALASMNLWCFPMAVYDRLATGWKEFHAANAEEPRAEFLLPEMVGQAVSNCEVVVDVLPTVSTWLGVTYVEDDERVRAGLRSLREK